LEAYRTEEEQVEALKRWWDENGRSTIIAIVLVISGSLGWQWYQDHRTTQAEAASQIYDDMIEALALGASDSLDESSRRTAEHLATRLKTEYEGSAYSGYAGLFLAKNRVEADDLSGAEEELRWVLANVGSGEIGELAQIRLARVLSAGGDYEQALKILDGIEGGSFPASVARARGDIYLSTDREEMANTAYQEALALGGDRAGSGSSLLATQVSKLNPVAARPLPATTQKIEQDPATIESEEE
jgi:predicted negative regulator of RcsB-dependent stress response